ncbi:MAG: hypothetical protein ACO3A2_09610 [Bdellovibrionia bacterium]
MDQVNWPEIFSNQTKEIIDLLNSEGLSPDATDLYRALRGGSTGSEVWGGVRACLYKIPVERISASTKEKIFKLIEDINSKYGNYFS